MQQYRFSVLVLRRKTFGIGLFCSIYNKVAYFDNKAFNDDAASLW